MPSPPPAHTLGGVLGRHREARPAVSPARSFDPNRVGTWEWRAWVAYYRRRWGALLVASAGLVHAGFRMSWTRTLRGAWLVLRANQRWAPFPDNDPEGARRLMERFYRLTSLSEGSSLDAAEAARREIGWWRAHREMQHAGAGSPAGFAALVEALVALYSLVYDCEASAVRPAAELRAEAMVVSDRWVREGRAAGSPLLAEERALLVRSYAALLAVVHRVRGDGPAP